MGKTLFAVLALLTLTVAPLPAQPYHPMDHLGEKMAKTKPLSQSGNAGGRNILENSCIYNDTFALSASEELLDHCDKPTAIAQFIQQNGQPDTVSQAPGDKTVLEYHLLFKGNAFRVKMFLGCEAGKTEAFAMVDCINEHNRIMPGGPPDSGGRGGRLRP